jgi:glycosyltransferase involved in cell wall biosynthesis
MTRSSLPRIAFVTSMAGSPWGGSEVLWHGAALHMNRCGLNVQASVHNWSYDYPAVRELAQAGIPIHSRMRQKRLLPRLLDRGRQLVSADCDPSVDERWLRQTGADLVVVSQGYPLDGIGWMTACKRLGIRYATVVQAAGEWYWPDDVMRSRMREAYAHSRPACFVSKANLECVELQLGMRLSDAKIVCNPWHRSADAAVRWPDDDGFAEMACVARLDPKSKGQDLLLRVMSQDKWKQRPLRIHLYGHGPCKASLMGLSEMLGLKNTFFHGRTDDIAAVWRRSHAMILPSRYEGMPLAILEAMRCARPVITTDVAGNAEHVRDGWNGFVAAAPTVGLIDEALERAWSARSEWQLMGERARYDILSSVPENPFKAFASVLLESIGCRLS